MKTEMGELIVGAYLKLVRRCSIVDYNVRPPETGLEGLAEFDVLGLDLESRCAYLCEVSTHLNGLNYGGNKATIERIHEKHKRQKAYAKKWLKSFKSVEFMFWSPYVPVGIVTDALDDIDTLNSVINGVYRSYVDVLRGMAADTTRDVGNDFFRALQIIEHLRESGGTPRLTRA